jgi:hypothetical protein
LAQPVRASLRPTEIAYVGLSFDYLKALVEQCSVILAGRTLNTDESSFGIVIFKAESEDAARAIMNNDPAVQAGVMHARLFPYRIALMADRGAH